MSNMNLAFMTIVIGLGCSHFQIEKLLFLTTGRLEIKDESDLNLLKRKRINLL